MVQSRPQVFQSKVLSLVTTHVDILLQFREKGFKEGKKIGSLYGQVFPQNGNLTRAIVNVGCKGDLPNTLTVAVEADMDGENPRIVDFFWDD